jgi:hypothetical protein
MSIRTLASRIVYQNPWMRVREDQIERSNGKAGIYREVNCGKRQACAPNG